MHWHKAFSLFYAPNNTLHNLWMAFCLHMKIVYVSSFCKFVDFFFSYSKSALSSLWHFSTHTDELLAIHSTFHRESRSRLSERPVVLISKVRYCRMGPNGTICGVLSSFAMCFGFLTLRFMIVWLKLRPITIQCRSSLWIMPTPAWAEAEHTSVLISKVCYCKMGPGLMGPFIEF